jgi:DNA-binding transcriptional MerR regulator
MNKTEKRVRGTVLAKASGLRVSKIRFYQRFGILPHIKNPDNGYAMFNLKECLPLLKKIRHLQEEKYLPLEVIKAKYLKK